ncbi:MULTISPECIES: DeoR/GlpR family DNA-binding transcription regulator [Streptococcus]|uniref:DeoR/GlpR family DNA-binding transcription regulator n=4 Tax=Streptococcus TaxID=1301 RepID=A0A9X8T379_STREQ|nr:MULTISPECIES: DeoR/GlpR family DNA-binding transcription regulator [Streptococcus]KKC17215.1 DeoR faimly transcriptional regulator [Streptococcus dysgalactiae subsp. equisimilis]KKC19951.1 DeoR faimly transcriptional regulator [Streptococcus dysgalactiae subsp. equisimilis]KKC20934.1 DeoR faimly transcriptional regulator [Streptococcus dysgalactiae subsp. equisimilis]KKC22506.1 DeoR faimly transcriptional regulator [Streptococcus dysgalactiae subsp. equisimilis]MBM6513041.1 DeoR/GlpR transc
MAKIVEDNYVALEDLMQLLDSSESTVRRDLGELEQEGRLHRVHGGAELFHSLQEELSNQEKSVKNSQIKQALAQKASRFVYDNDVIFIDAGTTTEFLLPFLQGKNVTVVTNSIHHATRLVDLSIKTIIIGGYVKQTTDASIGSVALEQIRQMNFDKAFLGMNGVDEAYLTTPDMEEAVIKKAVIANAKVSYILVDGTKIGQVSFVKVAAIDQVTIITEAASTGILKKIKEKAKVIEL